MRRVYLDSNATTPLRPEVVAAMMPVFTEHFGNASSIHWFGQHAKSLIDDARQHLAKLINAEPAEIVFLSGGITAVTVAIRGIAKTGKIRVNVKSLGIDLYSMFAHKTHGRKGVGALFVKKGTALKPTMTGGGHERNRRSGTENVAGIVGFGEAARRAREGLMQDMPRVGQLRDRLEAGLQSHIELIHVNGRNAPRLPNTTQHMGR